KKSHTSMRMGGKNSAFAPGLVMPKHEKIYPFVWPMESPNGDILAVRYNKGFYLLTPKGSLRRFVQQPEASFRGRPVFLPDGTFLLGSAGAYFYGYQRDGSPWFRFFTGGRTVSSASYDARRNVLYLGNLRGHLYALHTVHREKK
ncbi:MAG: hypothetical protein AAGJ35_06980, partial [Myxococcota bacterium]